MSCSRPKTLGLSLLLTTGLVFAAPPKQLVTHNKTDVESNAYIVGKIPSQHPSRANSDNKVPWVSVKIACHGHMVDSKCSALIKMATNTNNPVDIGYVNVDINTGDIMPTQISGNGYTLVVNGPGECTIIKTP